MHRSNASDCSGSQGCSRCKHPGPFCCSRQEVDLTKQVVVAAAILRPDRSLLAARRIGKSAGFWELPGGKVEDGETPLAALSREVLEELGVQISFGNAPAIEIGSGFDIDDERILRVYRCTLADPTAIPKPDGSHDEIRWLAMHEWLDVKWLDVDLRAVLLLNSLFHY